NERKAEMSREIGMLEIGFVMRPWCEENNARLVAPRRSKVEEHSTLLPEEGAQTLHVAVTDFVGQNSRDHVPIFPGVTGSARSLGAVRQDPPLAIGRAPQVTCMQMQINLRADLNAAAGTQKSLIRIHQFGREKAIAEEAL